MHLTLHMTRMHEGELKSNIQTFSIDYDKYCLGGRDRLDSAINGRFVSITGLSVS